MKQIEMQNAFRAMAENKKTADIEAAVCHYMMLHKKRTGISIAEQVMFDIDMELNHDIPQFPAELEP